MHQLELYGGFTLFVLAMLAIDLGVFHRRAHEVSLREAGAWSAVWVSLALTFNYGVYHFMGAQAGLEFLTGYLIEKALSVDNIFVFVLVFSYFRVPARYQHRVLFWGILGALLMRGAMIAAGAVLIVRFHWIIYVFGAFLVVTGIKMYLQETRRSSRKKISWSGSSSAGCRSSNNMTVKSFSFAAMARPTPRS